LAGFARQHFEGLLPGNFRVGKYDEREGNTMKQKAICYWVSTGIVAFCIGSGGAAELAQVPGTVDGLVRLGYPAYFVTIIGFWKVLGALAILAPGFPRLKEWAYAGIFFNMTGAAATGLFVGVAPWHVIVDLVLTFLTVASWALRPASRRVEGEVYKFAEEAF
jgi:DoxX-like family